MKHNYEPLKAVAERLIQRLGTLTQVPSIGQSLTLELMDLQKELQEALDKAKVRQPDGYGVYEISPFDAPVLLDRKETVPEAESTLRTMLAHGRPMMGVWEVRAIFDPLPTEEEGLPVSPDDRIHHAQLLEIRHWVMPATPLVPEETIGQSRVYRLPWEDWSRVLRRLNEVVTVETFSGTQKGCLVAVQQDYARASVTITLRIEDKPHAC